jgi:hypothetical protein
MIIGLDAVTCTLVHRPGRTAQAIAVGEESAKVEERPQALVYLE